MAGDNMRMSLTHTPTHYSPHNSVEQSLRLMFPENCEENMCVESVSV